ncbi:hypothetical protein NCC49_003951 [Naganishia albida]|nr:hypothetical protein NCC49_003951 [Naganishia albida]
MRLGGCMIVRSHDALILDDTSFDYNGYPKDGTDLESTPILPKYNVNRYLYSIVSSDHQKALMADTMVKHIRRRLKESIIAKPAAKKKVGKKRGKTAKDPPPTPNKTDLKDETAAKESSAFLKPKMAQSPSDSDIATSSTAVPDADAK